MNTVLGAFRIIAFDDFFSNKFLPKRFEMCTVYSVGARCLLCWGVFGLFSMKLKKKVLNVPGYSISLRITVQFLERES